ncbi:MAG: DUF4157 domain-containing protein [Kofleriaceae bacterium]
MDDDVDLAVVASPGKRTGVAEPAAPGADTASPGQAATPGAVRVDRYADASGGDGIDDLTAALGLVADLRAGQALPAELARTLERDLGMSLGHVRLHDDARAHAAAAQLRARAFTVGSDIYFAAGAFDPHSEAGVALIAHEAAHVAQQARGTAPTARGVSQPSDGHEREAEAFARQFQSRHRIDVTAKPGEDPATLIDRARREGRRIGLPFQAELEEQLGTSFDFVEAYTGPAAQIACEALSASAMVVRNIILLADPSPNRELLLHELTHVQQMGQRRAPAQFALGTLRVSDPGDPAEVEARAHAAPTVAADPDTIHRAGPDASQTTPSGTAAATSTPAERVAYFVEQHKASGVTTFTNDGKDGWNRFRGKTSKHNYANSSKEPFKREDYIAVLDKSDKKSDNYTADMDEIRTKGSTYKIARVTDRTYAYLGDAGKYDEEVDDISPSVRPKADPQEQFACYFKLVTTLSKRISDFTFPVSAEEYKKNDVTMDAAQADAYRRALRKALVDGYKALAGGGWQEFYEEVMKPRLIPVKYNALTGAIFEDLVRAAEGVTLSASKPMFKSSALAESPRIGDSFSGSVLVDGKAATAGAVKAQAEDYLKIVKTPIPGWIKGEDENDPKRIFQAVLYTAAGKDNATKINNQLKAWFPNAADYKKFGVTPDPEGMKTFIASFNPTLMFRTEDAGKGTYTFKDPINPITGVKVKEAKFVANADDTAVTGGSIKMDVEMGDAVKGGSVSKPITPGTGPGLAGSVDNKFEGFKSSLDKVLGAVKVDAKLVDGGVEASITLTPGAAKIPQFEVGGGVVTARYVNGALTVSGEVDLTHKSKKISAKVKVAWDGTGWSFDGSATLAEGLVPGLSGTTLRVTYAGGKTKIFADQASYERKIGAVTLKGTVRQLEYDVDAGSFSGSAEINADLGMFGKASASATIEKNDLAHASFTYDSPEFKYPAKDANPAFKGTIGGTITYDKGKFSGAIRGSANINLPALKAVAGDNGAGLAVDAHINADGTYGGTVKTTSPLKFGKHVEVPSVSCTVKDDGSLEGTFEINVVKIKYLDKASIKCKVTKAGIEVEDASIEVPFGSEQGGSFWGKLTVGYAKGSGLKIGGTVNYKIKEGMVATGTLTYSTESHEVSLSMTVSEITLLDKTVSKKLFSATKQIPIVSVYGLGIYIDIGFELGFNFGFKLGLKPTVDFEGLSLETFDFKKIQAKLELLGNIFAELTGTPKLGLGVFALSPSILRGGGGLKVPIVGRAEIKPTGTLSVAYSPSGGVEGDAKVGMNMTFGISGSVKPYAEFSVLDGLWNPSWEGGALTSFEILKPKELFSFVVDLGGDMKKKEAPELPGENAAKAPSTPAADKILPEKKSAPTEKSGGAASKETQGPTGEVAESGDEGPFSLSALKPLLGQLPGAAKIKGILEKAYKMYEKLKDFFGRVVKTFKSFFDKLASSIEEIVDGFGREGLSYLPKLVKKIVGDATYEIIEPLVQQLGNSAEKLLDLFETDPPTNLSDIMPWVWKLAKKAFGLAFDSLSGFVSAIRQMMSRAAGVAKKLVNRAVTDGWIGVKRHGYYIWRPWPWDDYKFMAAAEYKLNIPGVANLGHGEAPSVLLTPGAAVALGLYEFLEDLGVPITYVGRNESTGQPYNDRWKGAGQRG